MSWAALNQVSPPGCSGRSYPWWEAASARSWWSWRLRGSGRKCAGSRPWKCTSDPGGGAASPILAPPKEFLFGSIMGETQEEVSDGEKEKKLPEEKTGRRDRDRGRHRRAFSGPALPGRRTVDPPAGFYAGDRRSAPHRLEGDGPGQHLPVQRDLFAALCRRHFCPDRFPAPSALVLGASDGLDRHFPDHLPGQLLLQPSQLPRNGFRRGHCLRPQHHRRPADFQDQEGRWSTWFLIARPPRPMPPVWTCCVSSSRWCTSPKASSFFRRRLNPTCMIAACGSTIPTAATSC